MAAPPLLTEGRTPWQIALLSLTIAVALTAGDKLCAADGKSLFVQLCAPCHGKDGQAKTPIARKLGVKDLSQSKASDAEIKRQILEGRQSDKGTQTMPSYKGKLTEEEIQALVTVVKGFRMQSASWPGSQTILQTQSSSP